MDSDPKDKNNPPAYDDNSNQSKLSDGQISSMLLENERLKTLLQSLLLQTLPTDGTNNNNTNGHARLFRLDADLSNPHIINSLINPIVTEDNVNSIVNQYHLVNESDQSDFSVDNVDYDYLAMLSNNLQSNLDGNNTTTTTTNQSYPTQTNTPMVNRTSGITGPNDQRTTFELPGVASNERHLVNEIPSITSVQNNIYNPTTSNITIITQRTQEQLPPNEESYHEKTQHLYSETQAQDFISRQQSSINNNNNNNNNNFTWQEALVLEIPQSEFWIIVPHTLDSNQREERNNQLRLEDSTAYFELDEVDEDGRPKPHPTRHEFGSYAPSPTLPQHAGSPIQQDNNDDYVLLETERIQESLVNYIASMVASIPSIGQFSSREILDALTSVLVLDDAKLEHSYTPKFGTTSNTTTTTTTTTPNHTTTTNTNNNKNEKKSTNNDKKKDEISAKDIVSTAQFVSDAVYSGKIDPQKAINQLQRFLPQKVTNTYGILSWLYDWSTWSYSIWSYGATFYSIYRNPLVGASILTWVYKGVTYALLFCL